MVYGTDANKWRESSQEILDCLNIFFHLPVPRTDGDEILLIELHEMLGWRFARDPSGHDYYSANIQFAEATRLLTGLMHRPTVKVRE